MSSSILVRMLLFLLLSLPSPLAICVSLYLHFSLYVCLFVSFSFCTCLRNCLSLFSYASGMSGLFVLFSIGSFFNLFLSFLILSGQKLWLVSLLPVYLSFCLSFSYSFSLLFSIFFFLSFFVPFSLLTFFHSFSFLSNSDNVRKYIYFNHSVNLFSITFVHKCLHNCARLATDKVFVILYSDYSHSWQYEVILLYYHLIRLTML